MVNVPLRDGDGCVRCVERLLAAGCRLIRFAVATRRDLFDFCSLRRRLPRAGVAYVADLHFGSELALAALEFFEKVRINPGNFGVFRTRPAYDEESFSRERERVAEQALAFFQKAARLDRAVRIGCNGGSPAGRMRWRHGEEAALFASAREMGEWAREAGLEQVVFSFKASDCARTVEENLRAARHLAEWGWDYPLHLGMTEAGNGPEGRIRGAIAVGALLSQGLGDTLRLSLAEAPEREVEFGKKLLTFVRLHPFPPPRFGGKTVAVGTGSGPADLCIGPGDGPGDGALLAIVRQILSTPHLRTLAIAPGRDEPWRREVAEWTLQSCGWGQFRTEIVACPTCGRTSYDVAAAVGAIRSRLGNLPGVRIAVMGCVVNGVGEMGHADYGYIGCGNGMVNIYRRGICLLRAVPEENAIDALEKCIYPAGKVRVQP
jgi:1-hydroxy-2-methyl-2-(E)-butenyl 4-diphosphate synthase